MNAWVNAGVSVATVLKDFALGDQFTATEAAQNASFGLGEIQLTSRPQWRSSPPAHIGSRSTKSRNTTVVFNNAATEILAHPAASNAVNITSAGSASQAIDMAAASASTSQSGGAISPNGVIDWFQFGGNTYMRINSTSTPETQTALTANDTVVELVGVVDLSGATFSSHALSLESRPDEEVGHSRTCTPGGDEIKADA